MQALNQTKVMLKPVKRPANAWKEAYECGVRAGAHTRRRREALILVDACVQALILVDDVMRSY